MLARFAECIFRDSLPMLNFYPVHCQEPMDQQQQQQADSEQHHQQLQQHHQQLYQQQQDSSSEQPVTVKTEVPSLAPPTDSFTMSSGAGESFLYQQGGPYHPHQMTGGPLAPMGGPLVSMSNLAAMYQQAQVCSNKEVIV
jgi:hypothetical protein